MEIVLGNDMTLAESLSEFSRPFLMYTLNMLQIPHSVVCQKAITVSVGGIIVECNDRQITH